MADNQQNIIQVPPILPEKLDFDTVIANERIPKIFANGFLLAHSLTDATIITQIGATPTAAIFMSFPALKNLHKTLSGIITNIEKGLGHEIEDIKTIQDSWSKNVFSDKKVK